MNPTDAHPFFSITLAIAVGFMLLAGAAAAVILVLYFFAMVVCLVAGTVHKICRLISNPKGKCLSQHSFTRELCDRTLGHGGEHRSGPDGEKDVVYWLHR